MLCVCLLVKFSTLITFGQCSFVEIADESSTFGVIVSGAANVWGGESGANDRNVAIGITWTENEPSDSALLPTDLVRLALERCATAADAVDCVGRLAETYCADDVATKYAFLICDSAEAWLLNVVGRLWASERIADGFRHIPLGLTVGSKIDRCSVGLHQTAQDMAVWDGSVSMMRCAYTDDLSLIGFFHTGYF